MRLRRQIPYTVAMDLLLTAREVAAEEAMGSGSSAGSSPTVRPWTRPLRIAEVIGANGPLAVEAIMRSVRETEGLSESRGPGKIELEIGWPIFATEDASRGPEGLRREAATRVQARNDARGRTRGL